MSMPSGRFERRIATKQVVELFPVGESPMAKIKAITENVSSRGVRVITDSTCAPGKRVHLEAPDERRVVPARVVYCQRLEESKFAVGLQIELRFEESKKF